MMFKRNRYKQRNGNLILYPDYGNLKGFAIIGLVALLFCYALYRVNAIHHHIAEIKMYYMYAATLLLISAGLATAYKKVIINSQTQKVSVSYLGIKIKEIGFADILGIETRSSSLPEAFYVILKSDPIGSSIRLSPTYGMMQQTEKSEFYNQILSLIMQYLVLTKLSDQKNALVEIKYFKRIGIHLYRYISSQKIIFACIQLVMGGFFFILMVNCLSKFSFTYIGLGIFCAISGLLLNLLALLNLKILHVDTYRKVITETFLGFVIADFHFSEIEKKLLRTTQINGFTFYTSLIIVAKDNEYTITKSLSTQILSNVDRELDALIQGNIAD